MTRRSSYLSSLSSFVDRTAPALQQTLYAISRPWRHRLGRSVEHLLSPLAPPATADRLCASGTVTLPASCRHAATASGALRRVPGRRWSGSQDVESRRQRAALAAPSKVSLPAGAKMGNVGRRRATADVPVLFPTPLSVWIRRVADSTPACRRCGSLNPLAMRRRRSHYRFCALGISWSR